MSGTKPHSRGRVGLALLLGILADAPTAAKELSKGAALCRSRIEAELASSAPIKVLEVSEEGWGHGLVSTDIVFDVTNRRGASVRKTGTCKIRTSSDGGIGLEEFFMPLQRWEFLGEGTYPAARPGKPR